MGIDGSGKTTVVEWLAEALRKEGHEVDVLWLRFNHLLAKPLLAFCRLAGYTRYETVDGIRVGYHDFYRSGFVSRLFVALQYLDALRVYWTSILPRLRKKRVLILDRFVHDILIDLMVDTRIQELDRNPLGRALLRLLPKESVVIPLRRAKNELLAARPESAVDRNFSRRLQLYEELPGKLGMEPIDNDQSLDVLLSRVAIRAGLKS